MLRNYPSGRSDLNSVRDLQHCSRDTGGTNCQSSHPDINLTLFGRLAVPLGICGTRGWIGLLYSHCRFAGSRIISVR
jgi:hypothetical protein